MLSINFKSNIKEFSNDLSDMHKKQIPFATVRALTWTAQDAQKYIQSQIQKIFKVTKKWWLKKQPTGIKIKSATKIDLKATVYTKVYFAELQEEGGTRKPHKANKLTIPSTKVPKSRRKAGGAAQMLKSENVYATDRGIYRRKGGKRSKRRELLFHKTKTAHVSARFGFKNMAKKIAEQKFDSNFWKSFKRAIKW